MSRIGGISRFLCMYVFSSATSQQSRKATAEISLSGWKWNGNWGMRISQLIWLKGRKDILYYLVLCPQFQIRTCLSIYYLFVWSNVSAWFSFSDAHPKTCNFPNLQVNVIVFSDTRTFELVMEILIWFIKLRTGEGRMSIFKLMKETGYSSVVKGYLP